MKKSPYLSIVETTSNSSHTIDNYRLPDVVPWHYDIKFILHEENCSFDGESTTNLEILKSTTKLSLNEACLNIFEAATKLVSQNEVTYVPMSYDYDYKMQMIILKFESVLFPGIYTLYLKFDGYMDKPSGMYRHEYDTESGKQYVITMQSGPMSARRVFPCWDEPAFKARFTISINHKRKYTALSNVPILQRTVTSDGTMWTHFQKTLIMSTFHVAFVLLTYDFDCIPHEDATVNVWCRRTQTSKVEYTQDIAVKSKQLLTQYTNSIVKIPKIDLILIDSVLNDNFEHWGLILYNYKVYKEGEDDIITKYITTETIAVRMTQQWINNTVDPSWWTNVFNQGLAQFVGHYIISNQLCRDLRKSELFVIDIHQKALHTDMNADAIPIIEDVTKFVDFKYINLKRSVNKMSSLLRMLYHILTGEVFQKGVIKYLNKHQFSSSTTSDDVWKAFQEALDESDVPHADYNVKEVMDTWIKQKHYPVVYVTRDSVTGDVTLTQKHVRPRSKTNDANDEKWWIPITFATRSNPDFSNTRPVHWLKPHNEKLIIERVNLDDWVIVNVQETGFYRVQYDFLSWYTIAGYLNSNNYEDIHVLNRAQMLDDFYHLEMTRPIDLVKCQMLATYLHKETNYIAWASTFNVIRDKRMFSHCPDIHSVKTHLVGLLTFFVEHLGPDENPAEDEFTKFARVLTLEAAFEFGNTACVEMIEKKRAEVDHKIENLPPNTQIWVSSIMMGQENMICEMDESIDDLDNTAVVQKTWLEKPCILVTLLDTALTDEELSNRDFYTLCDIIIQHYADNDIVLDYLLANIDKIIDREYPMYVIFTTMIRNIHSAKRLNKVKVLANEFFDRDNHFELYELSIITTTINARKNELRRGRIPLRRRRGRRGRHL